VLGWIRMRSSEEIKQGATSGGGHASAPVKASDFRSLVGTVLAQSASDEVIEAGTCREPDFGSLFPPPAG